MKNAPAAKLLVAYVGGIFAGYFFTVDTVLGYSLFAASMIIAVSAYVLRQHRLCTFAVLGGFIFLGLLLMSWKKAPLPVNHVSRFSDADQAVCLQGQIIDPIEYRRESAVFTVACDTIWLDDDLVFPVSGTIQVRSYFIPQNVSYGDIVFFKGIIRRPKNARNPGEFDYRRYLANRGIYAQAFIGDPLFLLKVGHKPVSWFTQKVVIPARRYTEQAIDAHYQGQTAALLKGLLIADRTEIDPDIKEAFSRTGVIHVLAVSGLHVGFIVVALLFLFKLCRISEPFRTLLIIAVLFFYTQLTGSKAPVVRASVMASILLGATLFQRKLNIINALSLAALLLLLVNPMDLFDAGFQLSFVAVLGIVLIVQQVQTLFSKKMIAWQERNNPFIAKLAGLLTVSLAAQLATGPLTAFYFQKIALVALVANLIVVPVVGLIVFLGYLSVFLHFLLPAVADIYAKTTAFLATALIETVQRVGHWSFSYVPVVRPPAELFVLYFGALILFINWHHFRIRKLVILLLLLTANVWIYRTIVTLPPGLHVTFIDVGQGDAIFLQWPNGQNCLIDAGDCTDSFDYGERVVAPFLLRQGVQSLDHLLVTHSHSDHIGGVPYLLSTLPVGCVVCASLDDQNPLDCCVDSLCRLHHIPIRLVTAGDSVRLNDNSLSLVLHPQTRDVVAAQNGDASLNDASVVVQIYYGQKTFLFLGDAERASEQHMLNHYRPLLHSNIVKVGHHGSSTSGSRPFVQQVHADIAIVSVGRPNRFDHPDAQTLATWRQSGAKVRRTDNEGAIRFMTDGYHIKKLYW